MERANSSAFKIKDTISGENEQNLQQVHEYAEEITSEETEDLEYSPEITDMQSLPTRDYLEQRVVPLIISGMLVLARERPPKPVEFLAAYLLKNGGESKETV
ncbi:hypothetical protein BsWGS_14822 [Bradybaena similaris]